MPGGGLLASTAAVTTGNLASRMSGFARVLAVGAALGTTFVGNTYQSANLVSNVLFELLAAGMLSSVVVPPFVRLLDEGRRDDAERLAGSLLALALVALGVVTVVGLAVRPWIMRALTVAVEDQGVRRQEVELGSFLLVLFLPQVLLYAVGSVATGLLHGARRFAAPAFAPVANNLAVIATMGLFWVVRGTGGRPGLDLSTAEKLVLGLGTTAGVLAMTLVPVVALRRAGLRLRPRWDLSQPGLRQLGRDGAWAAGMLALGQVLLVTTLVLANRVEGGVVAYNIAFQLFLLPFALLGHPVMTTLYPGLSSAGGSGRWSHFAELLRGGTATLAFLVLPASALLVALAGPVARVLRFGALDTAGTDLVARLLAAYAVGLLGYAAFQLLARASYATGDVRTPTAVALGVAAGGSAVMVGWFALASGDGRLAAVGYGHSVAFLTGAAALWVAVRRRVGEPVPVGASLVRSLGCAVAAGVAASVVAAVIAGALPTGGRLGAVVAVAVAGLAGAAVYVGAQRRLQAPEPAWLRGREAVP
jgi:putative peptidoglycan lipid II flippase